MVHGRDQSVFFFLRLTLPETNKSPLKMDGWKMIFLLGGPIFRGFCWFQGGYSKLWADLFFRLGGVMMINTGGCG